MVRNAQGDRHPTRLAPVRLHDLHCTISNDGSTSHPQRFEKWLMVPGFHALRERRTVWSPATRRRRSSATRSMTRGHAPGAGCRKSRAVGYQGLSSRFRSQIQSAAYCKRIHTGFPKAPARCATDVQVVMTRSSAVMAAAVSAKSSRCGERSTSRMPAGGLAACAAAGPFWREKKVTPLTAASGASFESWRKDRNWSHLWFGSPAHTKPTRGAEPPSRLAQA